MLKFLQDYGLPISLSEAGPGIDEIIVLSHWLMLVLFVCLLYTSDAADE